MRGRGLLVAAAVLQIIGASMFFLAGLAQLLMGAQVAEYRQVGAVIGGISMTIALGYLGVSVALLGCRRWAWIASLALDGLSALSMISAALVGHVGLGELVILVGLIGAPLFVTIGLLIGGRHAVFATAAAASPPATPSGG